MFMSQIGSSLGIRNLPEVSQVEFTTPEHILG